MSWYKFLQLNLPKHFAKGGAMPPFTYSNPQAKFDTSVALDYFKGKSSKSVPSGNNQVKLDFDANPGDLMELMMQSQSYQQKIRNDIALYGNDISIYNRSPEAQANNELLRKLSYDAEIASGNKKRYEKHADDPDINRGNLELSKSGSMYYPVGVDKNTRKLDTNFNNPNMIEGSYGLTIGEATNYQYRLGTRSDDDFNIGINEYSMQKGDLGDFTSYMDTVFGGLGSTTITQPQKMQLFGDLGFTPAGYEALADVYTFMQTASPKTKTNAKQLDAAIGGVFDNLPEEALYALSQEFWQAGKAGGQVDVTSFENGVRDINPEEPRNDASNFRGFVLNKILDYAESKRVYEHDPGDGTKTVGKMANPLWKSLSGGSKSSEKGGYKTGVANYNPFAQVGIIPTAGKIMPAITVTSESARTDDPKYVNDQGINYLQQEHVSIEAAGEFSNLNSKPIPLDAIKGFAIGDKWFDVQKDIKSENLKDMQIIYTDAYVNVLSPSDKGGTIKNMSTGELKKLAIPNKEQTDEYGKPMYDVPTVLTYRHHLFVPQDRSTDLFGGDPFEDLGTFSKVEIEGQKPQWLVKPIVDEGMEYAGFINAVTEEGEGFAKLINKDETYPPGNESSTLAWKAPQHGYIIEINSVVNKQVLRYMTGIASEHQSAYSQDMHTLQNMFDGQPYTESDNVGTGIQIGEDQPQNQ